MQISRWQNKNILNADRKKIYFECRQKENLIAGKRKNIHYREMGRMEQQLKGRICLITGGARGIGASSADAFCASGAKGIVIADLLESEAQTTCERLSSQYGVKCIFVRTDVTDGESVKNLFQKAEEEFGTVDVLLNSAGICRLTKIEDLDEENWEREININLKGAFLCSKEALKIMKEKRFGKIVNITSVAGQWGGMTPLQAMSPQREGSFP